MANQIIDIKSVELKDTGTQLGFDDGRLTFTPSPEGIEDWSVYIAGAGHPQIVESGEEHLVLIQTVDGDRYEGNVLVGYTNSSEYGATSVLEGNGVLQEL